MEAEMDSGMYAELRERLTPLSLDIPPELRLYVLDLTGTPATSAPVDCLSDIERARVARFRRPHLAPRYILTRSTLRLLLGAELRCPPDQVPLLTTDEGRPYVAQAGIDFNLSHSAERALIALNTGPGQVGVDIEHCKPMSDLSQLARAVLTDAELASLSVSDPSAPRRFYQYWTVKESYLKAVGTGLQLSPRAIEVDLTGHHPRLTAYPAAAPTLLRSFTPAADYQAALILISTDLTTDIAATASGRNRSPHPAGER